MPDKPDRSIRLLIVPPTNDVPFVHASETPRGKDDLELHWASKFVEAYNKRYASCLELLGRSAEPGDVTILGESSTPALVQIAEAVNMYELRKEQFKERVQALLWTKDLAEALSGVKVIVCDSGAAEVFDINDRRALRAVAEQVRDAIREFAATSTNWLLGVHGNRTIQLVGGCEIQIHLFRYAPKALRTTAYCCWITALTMATSRDHYFYDAVKRKLAKQYGAPGSTFWLLIYSADCELGLDEEEKIVSLLQAERNPFDRIFAYFNDVAVQIHPPTDNTSVLRPKVGFTLLCAVDSLPSWGEDKRWKALD